MNEDRSKYGELCAVHLTNEVPRMGCGRRQVYAKIGNKWVMLTYFKAGKIIIRGKVSKQEFERIRKS